MTKFKISLESRDVVIEADLYRTDVQVANPPQAAFAVYKFFKSTGTGGSQEVMVGEFVAQNVAGIVRVP